MTRQEQAQLDQLIHVHGYNGLVAEMSAHAMRQVMTLEKEAPDPRRYAQEIGQYAWIAEVLGDCVDTLDTLDH